MPRDGSGIWTQPFPDVVEGTTIESAVYNGFTHDVEIDLNTPRPVSAGGTGASNARDAMIGLQGDLAYQVVTNYDSYPFVSGSFYSAASATASPVAGHAFVGQCYTSDPAVMPPAVPSGSNIVIEARDQNDTTTPGRLYVREKKSGVWGAWTNMDAAYVHVTGDTMTGNLKITQQNPSITLDKAAGTSGNTIAGSTADVLRWMVQLGDGVAETGSNAGSNFRIIRHNDTGTASGFPLIIGRSNGSATFENDLAVVGVVGAGAGGTNGSYYFGNTGTRSLTYNGTNYTFNGGGLVISGATSTTGTLFFGTGAGSLVWNGTTFTLNGGPLTVGSPITAPGATLTADLMVYRNATPTTGAVLFGNTGTKYLLYDGTNYNLVGGSIFTVSSTQLTLNAPTGDPILAWSRNGAAGPAIAQSATSWNFYSDAAHTVGVYLLPGGTAWGTFSDARLPYKMEASPVSDVLSRLGGVQLYSNVGPAGTVEMFFKAQELATTLPEIVHEPTGSQSRDADYVPDKLGDGNAWGITYDRSGAVALQGLKEMKSIVDDLLARIEALDGFVKKMSG